MPSQSIALRRRLGVILFGALAGAICTVLVHR
jgi:hypothetical protein